MEVLDLIIAIVCSFYAIVLLPFVVIIGGIALLFVLAGLFWVLESIREFFDS